MQPRVARVTADVCWTGASSTGILQIKAQTAAASRAPGFTASQKPTSDRPARPRFGFAPLSHTGARLTVPAPAFPWQPSVSRTSASLSKTRRKATRNKTSSQ